MLYRYEMHAHASGCSLCAQRTPAEMARAYAQAGYAGMVLTDHFLTGYTAVDRSLPWDAQVRRYYQNVEEARAEGAKWDFDVLFGLEHAYGSGKEVLTYGIDLDFLLDNPDLCTLSLAEYAARVHDAGGYIAQAHPFRERAYIDPSVLPQPELLDGVEVFNLGNEPEQNERARLFAEQYGLGQISGSDAHDIVGLGRAGIAAPHRLRTNADLIALLRGRNYSLIENGVVL